MVERTISGKRLRMVRGDITDIEVEAFVFDITEDAKLGSGYGGAIQQRGGIVIQKELDAIGSVPTGEAVVTQAGVLKAELHHSRQRPQVPRRRRNGQARKRHRVGARSRRGEGH